MLLSLKNITIDAVNDKVLSKKNVSVNVLRLDKIHPIISGNKLFKLHYFLQDAVQSMHKTIVTFGGAYSNHLVATAFACKDLGIQSIGIVRGEIPQQLSHTLQHCIDYGMKLKFISREKFLKKDDINLIKNIKEQFGECIIIPEGGFHPLGAKGAALIYDTITQNNYTHICTATGTATTLAGLLLGATNQKIISVPVLKNMTDIDDRINFLLERDFYKKKLIVFNNYHMGGYAKKTDDLLNFMNIFWQQNKIPTDFVYTAKMLFAIYDKIKNNYFNEGCKILCVHTGGLQGNDSLPKNCLLF